MSCNPCFRCYLQSVIGNDVPASVTYGTVKWNAEHRVTEYEGHSHVWLSFGEGDGRLPIDNAYVEMPTKDLWGASDNNLFVALIQ